MVVRVMQNNSTAVKRMMPDLVSAAAALPDCSCNQAAQYAFMTDIALIPSRTREKLALFYDKYWAKKQG